LKAKEGTENYLSAQTLGNAQYKDVSIPVLALLSLCQAQSNTSLLQMSNPNEITTSDKLAKNDLEGLNKVDSLVKISPANTVAHDAVFGTITEDGPNYRNVCTISSTLSSKD
jgi:hypothetical protein